MVFSRNFILYALSHALTVQSVCHGSRQRRNAVPDQQQSIDWTPCQIPGATLPTECGTLMVPLDYTDEACEDKLALSLLRVPASQTTKKGSILLNFGGPGAHGIDDLPAFSPLIQA
jgi:hypothetical protein